MKKVVCLLLVFAIFVPNIQMAFAANKKDLKLVEKEVSSISIESLSEDILKNDSSTINSVNNILDIIVDVDIQTQKPELIEKAYSKLDSANKKSKESLSISNKTTLIDQMAIEALNKNGGSKALSKKALHAKEGKYNLKPEESKALILIMLSLSGNEEKTEIISQNETAVYESRYVSDRITASAITSCGTTNYNVSNRILKVEGYTYHTQVYSCWDRNVVSNGTLQGDYARFYGTAIATMSWNGNEIDADFYSSDRKEYRNQARGEIIGYIVPKIITVTRFYPEVHSKRRYDGYAWMSYSRKS